MKLRYNPFPLIFEQGDERSKLACLAFFGQTDSPQGNTCLLSLLKQQRPDGAFPSRFDAETWGMQETIRHTLLLLKVGMSATGVNVSSAVQYVLKRQNPDGGWCENAELELPPGQTWLNNRQSITWLTTDVVDLLRQVGMGACPERMAALEWLRAVQNVDGGWPSVADQTEDRQSDPDATAQIAFLMAELYGEDDPVYLKGKQLFDSHLDQCAKDAERGYWIRLRDGERERLDVYHLTHLLMSWLLDPPRRLQSGYDAADPRVMGMMEALVDLQREDGGWRPFFSEESSPLYTVLAVEVLVLSGAIPREDLVGLVEPYDS